MDPKALTMPASVAYWASYHSARLDMAVALPRFGEAPDGVVLAALLRASSELAGRRRGA